MFMCHNALYLSPVDAQAITHSQPCDVKGTSPPGAAENNQIILSGDTSSFRRGSDGASSPLLRLHLSVSPWLYLTLSLCSPLSFNKKYYETS